MTFGQTTVVLGPEWDEALRRRLFEVLKKMGAIVTRRSWGVGGSQEVDSVDVSLGNDVLLVEAETYIGLTITGAKPIVEKIRELVTAAPA